MSPLFKSNNILAIEINAEVLKLAYLKGGSSPELLDFASSDIRALSDEQIIEFIRNYTTVNKIKATEVINVVPGRFTITKNIELPSTDPAEIRQIIQLQAGRHSPYSREEIVIDYLPIGVFKGGYTRVFLVIVNRDYIKRNMDIIEQAGLRLKKVVLGTETISQWYTGKSNDHLGLLHIDSGNLDFSVIHKGKPVFLRIIPLGANQLIFDREKYAQKIQEEIRNSVEAYQTEHLGTLSQLLVTGAVEKTDAAGLARDATGIAINTADWAEGLTLSANAAGQKTNAAPDVSFLSPVTAALRYNKTNIDLTPEEVKVEQAMAEKSKDIIRLGTLVILIFVLIVTIYGQKIWIRSSALELRKNYYDKTHAKALELKTKYKKISSVIGYLHQQKLPLESLVELQKLITDQVYFEMIGYKYGRDKQEIVLRGMANTENDMHSLRERLEKSAYFNNVNIKSWSWVAAQQMVSFEITCGFEIKFNTPGGAIGE